MAISNLIGASDISSAIVLAFDQSFIVAQGQNQILDQFASYRKEIGAQSITLPKFQRLAISTTPLSEKADPAGSSLSVAPLVFTPKEYGNVVSTTRLADLQTGGKADLAAAQLIGINMGQTMDRIALDALDTSTNAFTAGGGTLAAGNVANAAFLNYFYNKLARHSIQAIDGAYVAVMHDDVIADLRADATPGSWVDVTKYATPETTLKNEVGMFKGFRIIRNNLTTIDASGAVHAYNSHFLGANGLGRVDASEPTLTLTGPFDAFGRFVNVGWYGVFVYGLVDTDAVWKGVSASSVQ